MSVERVPNTNLEYQLIAFDPAGRERTEDGGRLMGQVTVDAVRAGGITDLFLFSHGWMGDVEYARYQYNNWIGAMAACANDIRRMEASRTSFKPLLVGLHWPSRPWGNERLEPAPVAFDVGAAAPGPDSQVEALVQEYAASIADTPGARAALRTVITAAREGTGPDESTPDLVQAYRTLEQQAGLGSGDADAAPGADHPPFHPKSIVDEASEEADDADMSFGGRFGISPDILLSPLRVLSFWKMKDRARRFGESGAHVLLADLTAAADGRGVRFHLMGHSFGCIVVSAMLVGPRDGGRPVGPVHSLALIQGALSLWSYCSDIQDSGRPGYFRRLIESGRVAGPIVTTQSEFDRAVGRFYPMGARLAGQVDFAPGELPKYGGVGTWGIRGPGLEITDLKMLPADGSYDFVPGKIYNVESSDYISRMDSFSGAHSDIARPEVAHAVWQAALGNA